jgi:cyclophilin family peptidyl-prolyl cis-trans isomerase
LLIIYLILIGNASLVTLKQLDEIYITIISKLLIDIAAVTMAKLGHVLLGLLVFIVFAALVLLQHSQLSAAFTGAVNSINHEHPMVNNILLKDQHLRAVAALASSVNSLEGRGDEKKSEVQVGEAKMEPPPEVVAIADEIKSPLASVASSVETLRRVVGGPLTSEEVLAQLSASDSVELSSVPDDTVTTVVSCATSKGNITIDIRRDWGPNGVDRYLDLVRANYFDDLPFFRVCPRYITQFGVKHVKAGDARPKCSSLNDDPSLWGIRDMDTGYLFYAGSGARSRGCQMVLALCDMPGCKQTTLGTTFWEVPIGTVRKEGHGVLKDIAQTGFPYPKLEMGGQHKDAGGPNQGADIIV